MSKVEFGGEARQGDEREAGKKRDVEKYFEEDGENSGSEEHNCKQYPYTKKRLVSNYKSVGLQRQNRLKLYRVEYTCR